MREDIDRLMKERRLDYMIICGNARDNANLEYFTGTRALDNVYLIKPQYGDPILITGSMERDEAAKTGLQCRDYNYFGYADIAKSETNPLYARVKFLHRICDELDIKGRVAVFGKMEINNAAPAFLQLANERNFELVWETGNTTIDLARITKSQAEIEAIQAVGKKSFIIYHEVRKVLSESMIKDGKLLNATSGYITIGSMKSLIRQLLAKLDLAEESDTIFSMGKESAVPHNYGTDEVILEPGKTIIMDMFPKGKKENYFFDMTRTFCVGFVPDSVGKLYADLKKVHTTMLKAFEVNHLAKEYQEQTCQLFEDMGHPTIRNQPGTINGFVHTLGHGIGLQVHEHPFFGSSPSNQDKLEVGSVFTVEPGLYYPAQEMGARIEDVVYIDNLGKPVNMTDFAMDLLVENTK